jgi:hypothetical protein
MPPRTDFLSRQRKQIVARLEELRPLYEEYLTLEKAQQALDQVGGSIRRATPGGRARRRTTRRGPGRPPGRRTGGRSTTTRGPGRRTARTAARGAARSTGRRTAGRRQGRPAAARRGRGRSGSTRADEALAVIRANPGISISDLAKKLRIRPNYLYRVTAALQREGRVRRRNRGFHAA